MSEELKSLGQAITPGISVSMSASPVSAPAGAAGRPEVPEAIAQLDALRGAIRDSVIAPDLRAGWIAWVSDIAATLRALSVPGDDPMSGPDYEVGVEGWRRKLERALPEGAWPLVDAFEAAIRGADAAPAGAPTELDTVSDYLRSMAARGPIHYDGSLRDLSELAAAWLSQLAKGDGTSEHFLTTAMIMLKYVAALSGSTPGEPTP